MQENIKQAKKIASLMLELRALSKEISTYYESVEQLIYPDGLLHPQFNHTSTATGRLSCKSPNVQNSPASADTKVPEHFISRFSSICPQCNSTGIVETKFEEGRKGCTQCWGRGKVDFGHLISADYQSLEVRIEAQLSGDINYISDIINGVDFHVKNLALKEGVAYERIAAGVENSEEEWVNKRSQIKAFTFATQYGAGNKKISEMTGFSEEEVQGIKDSRRKAYPRLHMYYECLWAEVSGTALYKGRGQYEDPWGRIYKFKKYPPKFKWQKSDSYSLNEIMNFRTQGFATGTIVLAMLGKFWREKALHNRDKYLLINTIHDSVMLDCRIEYVEIAKKDLQLLTECATISKELFDYQFIVPIEVTISNGGNWGEL